MSTTMDKNSRHRRKAHKPFLPTWFKLCLVVLVALIGIKLLSLQVFVQFELDGIPYRASLTEFETYLIPLGLLLIYIILNWIWGRAFGSDDDKIDRQ